MQMQIDIPESSLAAIGVLYAIVHEREYLRSAAIDLMRAGLPSNVAADICDFARIRRRECISGCCCKNTRYKLDVSIDEELIAVRIRSGGRTAAAFEFGANSCEVECGDWRAEHEGPPKDMPRTFRDVAMRLLELAEYFSAGCPHENRVIRETTEYVRDARDPSPAWWAEWGFCGNVEVLARISDDEVVVAGCNCDACYKQIERAVESYCRLE